jgi:hypothetical protein
MRRAFYLAALWAFTGGSMAFGQATAPGSTGPATGGGRPSNGGGAVPPSTRPAGWYGSYLGTPPSPLSLGVVKGRALPGSGVDRTKADFGGIAPNDLGPATRPDAGIGNPSTPQTRPDAGIGNPSTSTVRPDEQIGISRVPMTPEKNRFLSPKVPAIRPYAPLTARTTVFPGAAKRPGVVNPGWARKSGNAAAPSTAPAAVAKGTIYAQGRPAGTGGYSAEPPRNPVPTPTTKGITRPVPRTGIVNPNSSPIPNPSTTPGPGAGRGRDQRRPAGGGTPGGGPGR